MHQYVCVMLTTGDGQQTFQGIGETEAAARAAAEARAEQVLGEPLVGGTEEVTEYGIPQEVE